MMRQLLGVFALGSLFGCGPTSNPTAGTRTTVVPQVNMSGTNGSAAVLPDGRIVYAKYVQGKAAIYVASAEGSNERRLTFGVWDYGSTIASPDSKWIAFRRDLGGQSDVLIVPIEGGDERVVAASASNETPTGWLADGSGLLFTSSTSRGATLSLYLMRDGSSAPVFDVEGSVSGYLSPDGRLIGYQLTKTGKNTIWVYDRDKRSHRQLTTEGFETLSLIPFSPDGKSLVYESRRTGTSDLWRVQLASGERRQLTQDIADDVNPRWSPDGSRIAFSSTRGGQPDLWVLSTGEGDVERLTDDAVSEMLYGWAPDGLSVIAGVGRGSSHIYRLPTVGTGPVALTSGAWTVVGNNDADPTIDVSRDGLQVAYAGTKNGDPDIWTVAVAGGESRLVAGGPSIETNPTWSPDGKRIAFTSTRSGNPDIWVSAVDGGTPVQLTNWQGSEDVAHFSPTGLEIAFLSDHESSGKDLWVVPAAGGQSRRLTTLGTLTGRLRWNPDGMSLAFDARIAGSGGPAVFIVAAAGGATRQVTPASSFAPAWSPDGRDLAVSMCQGGYCGTEVWSSAGKRLRRLATDSVVYEFVREWSPDQSTMMIGFQALTEDGGDRVALRPAVGGPATILAGPAGFSIDNMKIGLAGKAVIATGAPYGTRLDRIAVPAIAKTR